MILFYIGLALVLIHVLVPLVYFIIMLVKAREPWNINAESPGDYPLVSIIIPTYNEQDKISEKLSNVMLQKYPLSNLEVIVVDSSTDNTGDIVKEWAKAHGNVKLFYIKEERRRGKGVALNTALATAHGDYIVTTDADSLWVEDSLVNAIRWLSNNKVGVVSCIKVPKGGGSFEGSYRSLYNVLRIGESKVHSTVVFHGELFAVKRSILNSIGGFPTHIGADDSFTGIRAASLGYRAIIPEDVTCIEYIPGSHFLKWRVRRAQHLIQSFTSSARLSKPHGFKAVYWSEFFIHVINPWLLFIGIALLAASTSYLAYGLLALGALLMIWPAFRVWVIQQATLIYAMIRNIKDKNIIWEKIGK